MKKKTKLELLAEMEGVTVEKLLSNAVMDYGCLGICTNKNCSYYTEVESDQSKGYCEECETHTVVSCVMLGLEVI